ncbi:thioredoxin domain-containing protein [Paenibacillus koleovorans]|uniref:thioredoxin domain-containing protein n=1 Tax=Paenibacillus koleovorans TaxID=121608 RepID=UPI000FD9BC9D|nr:thioredoxin domain-containing protein [Paenibacillus koleovorans]
MTMNNDKANRLAQEKSPYLLQHAYNPVDWYPWSEEAFDRAKAEDKPVFLSIGYSSCHWCHVMERESFEDVEVAELLNRDYISIKVDREERPDVDHLYMQVCQAMTGQGGWPLTIIMTPDKKPFFAGTYFPKQRKHGRYGMTDILPQIAAKWAEDRERVERIGEEMAEELRTRASAGRAAVEPTAALLEQAFEAYDERFDESFGGFGKAPKFPSAHNLSLLLRYYKRTGSERALAMVETTLDAMYRGGMFDHFGFGFARYSTDERWLVPHFEKMLYDNALLLIAYSEAYQATGKRQYRETAEQIATYVLRDMTDPEGGFYSAEDADSEGQEGKFYVWEPAEVLQVLNEEDGEWFCDLFDITREGNFEGRSIPNLIEMTPERYARLKGMTEEAMRERLERCRQALFDHRKKRLHPYKDDKVLTSWNGLMIAALSIAGKSLGGDVSRYTAAASKAAEFVLGKLRRSGDGRLLARYRDGEAAYLGYVDDYAFLVWGLIELYEATFELKALQTAVELNAQMLELFWDADSGGLYFYGADGEPLLVRLKEIYDGAMPSGNAVAALNMQRLARYTFDARLAQRAEELLAAFAGQVALYPSGHAMYLAAVDFAASAPAEIVLAGDPASPDTQAMLAAIRRRYRPNAVTIVVPPGAAGEETKRLIPLVQDKQPLGGRTTAYVCENFACQAPTTDLEELEEQLDLAY